MTEATDRRTAGLQRELRAGGIPALLVSSRPNVAWLTGFTGSAGQVYVPAEDPPVLVTDDRYALRAASESPGTTVVVDRTMGWLDDQHPADTVLAIEADVLTYQRVTELQERGLSLLPTSGLVAAGRMRKDDAEVDLLRRACDITVAAFDAALTWLEPGLTERQIAVRLERQLVDLGADGLAFPSIVAGGDNGAIPHHEPGERRVQAGDLLTMDFGGRVGGYHADMTRTVGFGSVPRVLRRIHDLVRGAQQSGVEAARAGVDTTAVDGAAREVIEDAGHGGDFRHGTGHGVGLEVHEQPFIGPTTPGTLLDRMTVTVEPGVYLQGVGGVRIEDVVLVDAAGATRLTNAPHDLIIL